MTTRRNQLPGAPLYPTSGQLTAVTAIVQKNQVVWAACQNRTFHQLCRLLPAPHASSDWIAVTGTLERCGDAWLSQFPSREPGQQKMSFSYAGAQDEFDPKISSSDIENRFVGTAIAKLLGAKLSNVFNSANQDPLRHPPR